MDPVLLSEVVVANERTPILGSSGSSSGTISFNERNNNADADNNGDDGCDGDDDARYCIPPLTSAKYCKKIIYMIIALSLLYLGVVAINNGNRINNNVDAAPPVVTTSLLSDEDNNMDHW
jgi:hypothetical protein